ncbi:acyl-CoA dehydrogenase family protein [Kitasatospora cheerisanensis]|uniref:acyl-CoA dehydrogenase family protein n=1 Tax=Kitasatospora cheerisanensis TaxID=81942 RepID=UPI00056BE81B|nr:acyl-CoA dehydrogenase family protein [Kitasatospora cheerisanensis]
MNTDTPIEHANDNPDDAPLDAAEILRRARELAPVLRKRAPEIEANRTLPADVVELLRATGVFRIGHSARTGGPCLTSLEQTEIIEAIAYGDSSAGWCAGIGAMGGAITNFLLPDAVRALYPSPDLITAGALVPAGRAERVPGGYRLSGHWPFGSGVRHADLVTSGAFVYQDGEPWSAPDSPHDHDSMQFFVPGSAVEPIDNWDTTGLCGTGSCDYTMTDVFVPEGHTFTFFEPRVEPNPMAWSDSFMRALPGVPLGITRAALDHAREVATTRYDGMAGRSWSDSWRVQTEIARCEAEFNAAREGVYGSLRRQWEVLSAGGSLDDLSTVERGAVPLAGLHAVHVARDVVSRLYDLLQTWSINRDSPMDRWLRDTAVLSQGQIGHDVVLESVGAYLLGRRPKVRIGLGLH